MSNLTNYSENLLATWLLTNGAVTRPTAWHLALFTAAPGEAGGGTECTGSGYARAAITFTVSGAVASGPTSTITFTPSGGTWGTVTHYAIFDASTGGNMLVYRALNASVVTADGLSMTASANGFTVTFD